MATLYLIIPTPSFLLSLFLSSICKNPGGGTDIYLIPYSAWLFLTDRNAIDGIARTFPAIACDNQPLSQCRKNKKRNILIFPYFNENM